MPLDVPAPGPLTTLGTAFTAPVKIHKEGPTIRLSQKSRLWFRAAVVLWALVVLSFPFILYSQLFGSTTCRFTCERSTGVCELNGRTRGVPRLADITRAEMDRGYNRRDGRNWGINLVTRDGKKYPIDLQRAIKDSVVADYRATVKAINAFLANPAQQQLDTSFTYVAGLSEKFVSFFYIIFGGLSLPVLFRIWTACHYTFEPGKVILAVRHPFQHQAVEIPAAQVNAVVNRQAGNYRYVELKLDGGSSISIVQAGRLEASAEQLAGELAQFLGKPVERA